MKKKIERERERERNNLFLYGKNMYRMGEWQIYSKMMRIRRAKIKEDEGQNNM